MEAADIAFRPEVIQISTVRGTDPQCCHISGKVEFSLPHGNILRYAVKCKAGVQIDVDVLFGASALLEAGQEVYLSIPKTHCLAL